MDNNKIKIEIGYQRRQKRTVSGVRCCCRVESFRAEPVWEDCPGEKR
jgi:hypothetical protein